MSSVSPIEKLIVESRHIAPDGFRDELVRGIKRASRQTTRRDDLKTIAIGVAVLTLVSIALFAALSFQHSLIIDTILSAK